MVKNKPNNTKNQPSGTSIISGMLKGTPLATPGGATHPMGSREKNALFNALGPISGERVLDAFAGSGALGYEALSRGAREVDFVENSPAAVRVLRTNLVKINDILHKNSHFSQNTPSKTLPKLTIYPISVANFCQKCSENAGEALYDVIIADPPYTALHDEQALESLLCALAPLLNTTGTLILSSPATLLPPENIATTGAGLCLKQSRAYAAARISFYVKS